MIKSMTDVYGYIRDEMLYAQRRYNEATEPYERAMWTTKLKTLYDMGSALGMTNLPGLLDTEK